MFITQPRIFVSSTILDMPNERKAAYSAVKNVSGFPIMSEFTMEAQSTDSVSACLSKVMESDIYVLILGARYGWQPDGKESITEMEYLTAKSRGIPILVFNTTYPKQPLQEEFEKRVNPDYFRKTVQDAFELQQEIEISLKAEIDKKQNEYFNNTEPIYANLVKIEFSSHLYVANLDIDKEAVKEYTKGRKRSFIKQSLHEYAVSALYMNGISFPHDWIVWNSQLITFHDLHDTKVGLTRIIDRGTVEVFSCEEFYDSSADHLSQFKYLLKKCLETKLYKLKINWIRDAKMFAFIPNQKDDLERWKPRSIQWKKANKSATRKVVDIKPDLKDKNKIFNLRCLAFRISFENFEKTWYLSIKPDWVFLWNDLSVCQLAYPNIQWLKKTERNIHVFNHFNFILRYLQPSATESLFIEYNDYPFLRIGRIESFDFAPIVPDNVWNNLEDTLLQKKLIDKDGNVELFET